MLSVKHKDQRVVVLIDTQNLYHSARSLYGARVNFQELLRSAVAGRQLIRAISYVIKTETEEEQSFFDALSKIGIETKVKDLQIFPGGVKKADWDVGIAIDAVKFAKSCDVVILASGDGDYIPLVYYLKNTHGVRVEIMAFRRSTSAKLQEAADEFVNLDEHPDSFLIKGQKSRRPRRS